MWWTTIFVSRIYIKLIIFLIDILYETIFLTFVQSVWLCENNSGTSLLHFCLVEKLLHRTAWTNIYTWTKACSPSHKILWWGGGGGQAQKPGMSPPAVAQSYRLCAHPKTPPLLSASIKVSGSTTVYVCSSLKEEKHWCIRV